MSEHEKELQLAPIAAMAAVAAFAATPLLRYAAPHSLLLSSLIAGTGVGLRLAALHWNLRRWVMMLAGSFYFPGGIWLAFVAADAYNVARANDARCAAIQRMMLAPNPVRSDGPDLFQALGCRPQNLPSAELPTKVRQR